MTLEAELVAVVQFTDSVRTEMSDIGKVHSVQLLSVAMVVTEEVNIALVGAASSVTINARFPATPANAVVDIAPCNLESYPMHDISTRLIALTIEAELVVNVPTSLAPSAGTSDAVTLHKHLVE